MNPGNQPKHPRAHNGHPTSGLHQWLETMALFQVALAPLLLGSVHDVAVLFHGVLSLVILAGVLGGSTTKTSPRIWVGLMGLGLGVGVLWTGLQLIPLPQRLGQILSPVAGDMIRFSRQSMGSPATTGWHPLSLGWPATLLELIKQGSYLCLFMAFANGFRLGWSRGRLARTLLGTGVAVTALGAVHWLGGAESWYWLYQPLHTTGPPGLRGSFINPNHQAAFLGLCTLVGVGLFSEQKRWGGRTGLLLAGSMICLAGSLAMVSRAGQAALAISLLLFVILTYRQRRTRRGGRSKGFIPVLIGILLITAAFSVWVFARPMEAKWAKTNFQGMGESSIPGGEAGPDQGHLHGETDFSEGSKVTLWGELAPPMVADFGWVGAGRGAGRAVYRHYLTSPLPRSFPYLENLYLQMAIEWGVPVSLLILVLMGLGVFRNLSHTRTSGLRTGSLCALLFLGMQNFFDFNLEFPGTAIPAMGLLAMISTGSLKPNGQTRRLGELSRTGGLALFLALAVLMVAGGGLWVHHSQYHTGALVTQDRSQHATTPELLHPGHLTLEKTGEIIHRWPTDAGAMRIAAWAHLQNEPGDRAKALELVNASLYFDPWSWESHLLAARILEHYGRETQANNQYRLALQAAPERTGDILERIWPAAQPGGTDATGEIPFDQLIDLVSKTETGLHQLADHMARQGRWEEAALAWEQVAALGLNRETGFRQAVHYGLKLPNPDLLIRVSTNWTQYAPDHWEPYRALGVGLGRRGLHGQGAEAYDEAIRLRPSSLELHRARLRLLQKVGDEERINRALDSLTRHGENDPAWMGESYRHKAILAERTGNRKLALVMYYSAHQFHPRDHQIINGLGSLLERSGQLREAAEFYGRAAARLDSDDDRGEEDNQARRQAHLRFREELEEKIQRLRDKQ